MKPLCIALALALCACSQSPDEKVKDTAQTVSSWAASLSFAGQQWAGNSVPKRFMRTTIDAADKELEKSAGAVEGKSDRVSRDISEVRHLADELGRAVERRDRQSAIKIASRLDALAQELQQQ